MAGNESIDAMLEKWFADNPEAQEALASGEEATEEASETAATEDASEKKDAAEAKNTASDKEADSGEKADGDKGIDPVESTETKDEGAETEKNATDDTRDKAAEAKAKMQADIAEYNKLFPNEQINDINEIPNAEDFAKMRMLAGFSVEKAAKYARGMTARTVKDSGKSHISSSAPKQTASSSIDGMTASEYEMARSVFGDDMSKSELESLFRRTKSK